MCFKSIAARSVVLGITGTALMNAQSARLPDESAGIDGIARTLISAFDQVNILALGEAQASIAP